jgi:hypothetical protein
MKTIYQNDLEELNALMNRIMGEIETYSHVSELLPKALVKQLEKFDTKVIAELERRELLY